MPTYSENGKNSYTAAVAVAKGNILRFSGSTDAAGLPTVNLPVSSSEPAVAIALTDANAGEKVAVKILGSGGTTLVKAGAALAAGAYVNSLGETAGDGDTVIGITLNSCGAGELVEIATMVMFPKPEGSL